MLKLKANWVRALTITGEDSLVSLAAKLTCCDRIRNSVNPLSVRALPRIRTFSRSFFSSSEDDEYSELGAPAPKVPSNPRKLMTEKPEPYKRTNRTKKQTGIPSESSINLKDDCSKLESSRNGTKSFGLPNTPLDDQQAVTIRITNISSETTDSVVHSICMSCGSLEGLVRTKEDAVDALFSVKDNFGMQSIIRKLNQTSMNDHRWSANIHPRDSSPAVRSKRSYANCDFYLGLDISGRLADLRRQTTLKKVLLEDLEYLHNALLHLEAHPHTRSTVPNDD